MANRERRRALQHDSSYCDYRPRVSGPRCVMQLETDFKMLEEWEKWALTPVADLIKLDRHIRATPHLRRHHRRELGVRRRLLQLRIKGRLTFERFVREYENA